MFKSVLSSLMLFLSVIDVVYAACDPATTNPTDCVCAIDLNGDGQIADANEMQQCSNLADGGLCGLDKQNCVLEPPPPQPAPGYYCPLTGLTDGCSQGAHNYVIDPATLGYAAGQPADFQANYTLGNFYQSAVNANLNNWNTAITCEQPNLSTGKIDTEICTNPPAPDPIAAPGYYCPLTGQTTGCFRGLHAYSIDPYTFELHLGPRSPNYNDFQALSVGTNYQNLINTSPANFMTAISCQSGGATELCSSPPPEPGSWQCPISGGTACTTGEFASVYNQSTSVYPYIYYDWLLKWPNATQSFIDATNGVYPTDGWSTAISCSNSTTQEVDLCKWVVPPPPTVTEPSTLVLEPEPTPPPPQSPPTYGCPDGVSQCIADETDGVQRCSPTQCADASLTVDSTPISTSLYEDDAGYDQNGNCLGDTYIFNGRAMRCHPKSIKTYFRNCCSNSLVGDTIPENVGAQAEMALKIEGITIAATVMYAAAEATATAVASGWGASASAGAGYAAAGESVNSLLGGWNLAFLSVAALNYLYSNACDQLDFETVLLKKSGFCYEYGTRCISSSALLGCLKKQTTFCCFNSKLARIVVEQGRTQLPQVDWGTVSQPNCRGFTPVEFQSLDFSRIDLSEYYGFIKSEIEQNLPDMQQTIETDVQQTIQNIP